MAPDRRDQISLKFIWIMPSNKTQVKFKKGGYMPIKTGISYASAWFASAVYVFLDGWTRAGSKLCYRLLLRDFLVSLLTAISSLT